MDGPDGGPLTGAGALVTGAASGLGAATVRELHRMGATVVAADVNDAAGAALVEKLGERAAFQHADVTDEDAVTSAVVLAAQPPRGLRVAVACAGIATAALTVSRSGPHPLAPFQRVIGINLIGTFNLLRLAAASMVDNEPEADGQRGVVVHTASIAAFESQVGQLAYATAKGGVVAMTLAAARDLARYGVRVCTIAPGTFDTPLMGMLTDADRAALADQVPFPSRLGEPGEFAALVGHITQNRMLNGVTIRLDGALRMPPR